MEREASCVCGQLKVRVAGDPYRINMCNCKSCQRRSGSAFQIGAWFRESQVISNAGERTTYRRPAKEGRTVDLEFCPRCGVSVIFRVAFRPDSIGLHGGCFADPEFPAPTHVLYTAEAYHWVTFPEAEFTYEGDD